MNKKPRHARRRGAAAPLMVRPISLAVLLACSHGASANPTGPQVAAGAASFKASASKLTVTNAPGTIINWQSFSIGSGERTRFLQESASSAVLNRVVGNDGSSILGRLTSNGRVFLVNPHGIVVGAGAQVDTAGFIASTLNMADSDFRDGKFRFEGGGNGVLRNEGTIRASGDILLVGPAIENAGLIRSTHGSVLLAAGKSVTVTSPDAQGVKFELQAPTDSAINLGTIKAGNAAGMFAGTLKHSGEIRATTATLDGGRVVLSAQKEAVVQSGGVISVAGAQGGSVVVESGDLAIVGGRIDARGGAGDGGTVHVLGNRVAVQSGASIDASGQMGGGTILVGGDYQGRNADIRNAWRTFVGSSATLRADAIDAGDGGKVIVWADDITRFHGKISARGGATSGDGGFVETSGKEHLSVTGAHVDTSAPAGRMGTWLLDPKFIRVQTVGTATPLQVDEFGDSPGDDLVISTLAINTSPTNITLQANTDITFVDDVSMGTNGRGLTAQAGRSILVNANISTTNGAITLIANESVGVVAAERDPGRAHIEMAAGTILSAGGAPVELLIKQGIADADSGNITLGSISAGNISVAHRGLTPGGMILQPLPPPSGPPPSMLTTPPGGSIYIENSAPDSGPFPFQKPSIGTPFEPIRIATSALEANTGGGGGIFIEASGDLQIGGVSSHGGAVRGVQTLTGGDIVIRVNGGDLTRFEGSNALCGSSGGTGGPICANNGNIFLQADSIGTSLLPMHVDTGGGVGFNTDPHGFVRADSDVGGIFLHRRFLPLDTSGHILTVPIGAPVGLSSDRRIAVDASLDFPESIVTLTPAFDAEVGFFNGVTVIAATLNVALSGTGEMRVQGGATINADFNNTRPVTLNAGTLALAGNGTDTGAYTLATGTRLLVAGGTRNFNGATFSGSGTLEISDGRANFNGGGTTIPGPLAVSGGVLAGSGAVAANGGLTWTGGTIANTGGVTVVGTTTISTGDVTLNGVLATDRLLMTSGRLEIDPDGLLDLTGLQPSSVSGTIVNDGELRISGTGDLALGNAAIENTGVFDIQTNASLTADAGTSSSFMNGGTLRKSGGGGTSAIAPEIAFTNSMDGAIEVQAGALLFTGGSFTTNAGDIEISPSATLRTGALTNAISGVIGGSGTLDLGGETLTNNGLLRPGPPIGAAGTLTITGNLFQGDSGQINVTIDGLDPGAIDRLAVSGTATLAGTLNVFHIDNDFAPNSRSGYPMLTAVGGITGDFATKNFPARYESFYTTTLTGSSYAVSLLDIENSWIGTSGAWETPTNWSLGHAPTQGEDALINVGGAATTETITVSNGFRGARRLESFENIEVSGGELRLGPLPSAINATLTVSGGTFIPEAPLSATALVMSSGAIDAMSGTLPRLEMSGGTLMRSTPGDITIAGPFTGTGGSISAQAAMSRFITAGGGSVDGVTTFRDWINRGATALSLDGPLTLSSVSFTNDGVLNVNTGGLMDLQFGRLTNSGTLNINTSDEMPFGAAAGVNPIVNTGTVNKRAPDSVAGADFVDLVHSFSNSGTGRINVRSGTLSVDFDGAQSGTIDVAAGTQLNTDASLDNMAGGVISGRGTVNLFGNTLTNNGTVRPGVGGTSADPLTLDGNFMNVGVLDIQLRAQANNQFGRLAVTGTATLGGTLNLTALPGYAAPAGDTFTIVTAQTINGDFAPASVTKTTFTTDVDVYSLKKPSFYLVGLGGPNVNAWIGDTSGLWNDASRWSRDRVPLPSDQAFIRRPVDVTVTVPAAAGTSQASSLQSTENVIVAGTLELANTSSIDALLSITPGGTLQGAGAVTVTNLSLNGTIAGTGGVTVTGTAAASGTSTISGRLNAGNVFQMLTGGTMTIAAGGELNLSGSGDKTLAGGAAINASGTLSLAGTRDLSLNGGSQVTIESDGRLEIRSDVDIATTAGAAGTLINAGKIAKMLGVGTSTIGSANMNFVNNGGALEVLAGTIAYAGNSSFANGTSFTGAGTHAVAGAATFNGGITSSGGLTLRSGTFSGNANFGGTTAWTGGTIAGVFTIPALARLNVSGAAVKAMGAGASLTNSGVTTISDGADITGTGTFQNAGTLNVASGAGVDVLIGSVFNNASTVNVDGGNLLLTGGGTDSGTYAIDAGTTLDIAGGSRIFEAAVALPAGGTLRLSGGVLDVRGGMLPRLDLTLSGALTSSTGDLTISGPFNVSGGSTFGAGKLITAGTTTITGIVNPGRSWVNTGTLDLDSGQIGPSAGAGVTFTNEGMLNINTVDPTPFSLTADMPIINRGTINKNAAGNAEIFHAYTNATTGTLNINAGRLTLSSGVTQNGTINISSEAFLSTGGDAMTNAGTLGGTGTIELGGDRLTNAGTLRPGGPAGGAVSEIGTFTVDGNLVQSPSGRIEMQLAGTGDAQVDRLTVAGSAALAGTLAVSTLGAYTASAGDAFTPLTAASRTGGFDTITKTFANDLVPTYSTRSVSLTVGTPDENTWTSATSGSWDETSRWSQSRVPLATDRVKIDQPGDITVTIPAGPHAANILTSEENITLAGGLALAGASTVNATLNIAGGTLSGPGAVTINGALTLDSATLAGPGGVTVNGNTAVTGGASQLVRTLTTSGLTMLGGSLAVGADGVLNLPGGGARTISGSTLTNSGTVNIGGTEDVTLMGGALWDNFDEVNLGGAARIVLGGAGAATFINRGAGVITDSSTNAAPITTGGAVAAGKAFANAGALKKAVGSANVQTIDVPTTNTGEIEVLSGTLAATAFPSNSGIIDLAADTTFSTGGAPLTNAALGRLKGNGTLGLGGATFTNNGTVIPGASPGRLVISGNYIQGPDGTLVVELGGTLPGAHYDVLNVTGNAALGGRLVVLQSDGQAIPQGSEFQFLTYASRSGDFAHFAVPPGFSFQRSAGATAYTLSNTVAMPREVFEEVVADAQKEATRLVDRDPLVLTETAANTDAEAEKRKLGECR